MNPHWTTYSLQPLLMPRPVFTTCSVHPLTQALAPDILMLPTIIGMQIADVSVILAVRHLLGNRTVHSQYRL